MKHQESTTNNLYLPEMEHDACGIGAVVSIDGEKSRAIVDQALKIVEPILYGQSVLDLSAHGNPDGADECELPQSGD